MSTRIEATRLIPGRGDVIENGVVVMDEGVISFAGTAADGRALAWDTTDLSEGRHSITAEIIAADGTRQATGLKYYRITGRGLGQKLPYQPGIALARAQSHAEDFVENRVAQLSWAAERMAGYIARAQQAATVQAVSGKRVTPFLLQTILELTGGESLKTNIALVENNARLAARIAKAL